MPVKIRLRRTGANKDVSYRVVAADTRSPRDGRFLETLGWYDPKRKTDDSQLKLDRIDYWIGKGALVTDTVKKLIAKQRKSATAEKPA